MLLKKIYRLIDFIKDAVSTKIDQIANILKILAVCLSDRALTRPLTRSLSLPCVLFVVWPFVCRIHPSIRFSHLTVSLHAVIHHVKVLKIILAKLKKRQFSANWILLPNFNNLSFGTGFLHDDVFIKVTHIYREMTEQLVSQHRYQCAALMWLQPSLLTWLGCKLEKSCSAVVAVFLYQKKDRKHFMRANMTIYPFSVLPNLFFFFVMRGEKYFS